MIHTFRHIIKSLCIALLFISFSNLSATVEDSILMLKAQVFLEKQSCMESKNNGFQDKDISAKERIALIYLNNLLDYILEKNKSFLNPEQTFCITTEKSNDPHDGFHSAGHGLIRINISNTLFLNISNYQDTSLISILTHELAHEILKHRYQTLDIVKNLATDFYFTYGEEASLDNPQFIEFFRNNDTYQEALKRAEIEADNLGFQFYVRSGFNPNIYKEHFLHTSTINSSELRTLQFPEEIINLLIKFSKHIQNYEPLLEAIEKIKKLGRFDEFMNSIQYLDSKDEHPTGLWRFLNIHEQQEQILKDQNIDPNILTMFDTIYFKIDLHSIKKAKLKQIRSFFSRPDYFTRTLLGASDVRSFIIQSLLSNNPTVSVSLLTDPSNRSDIGILKNDDTIIIKGNYLFRLALIMIAKEKCLNNLSDLEEQFNLRLDPEKLRRSFIEEMNNLQQKMFTPICTGIFIN